MEEIIAESRGAPDEVLKTVFERGLSPEALWRLVGKDDDPVRAGSEPCDDQRSETARTARSEIPPSEGAGEEGVPTHSLRNEDRIFAYLSNNPEGADDDQLSAELGIRPRQQVNQICRMLAAKGRIVRHHDRQAGKVVNRLATPAAVRPAADPVPRSRVAAPSTTGGPREEMVVLGDVATISRFAYAGEIGLSEDQVKDAVRRALEDSGWNVDTAWGHAHGIDVSATRHAERLVIEAKGEGSRSAMRVNYFLGALGELLQGMESPDAAYGLALPAHRQFVGLVLRLPAWVRQHLKLSFYLVRPAQGGDFEVGVVPADVALGAFDARFAQRRSQVASVGAVRPE